jgi:hypothetical protein
MLTDGLSGCAMRIDGMEGSDGGEGVRRGRNGDGGGGGGGRRGGPFSTKEAAGAGADFGEQ